MNGGLFVGPCRDTYDGPVEFSIPGYGVGSVTLFCPSCNGTNIIPHGGRYGFICGDCGRRFRLSPPEDWDGSAIYSVVSDMFPKSCIGTLTGIAQCAAGLGSFAINICAGRLFTYAAARGDAFAFLGYTGKPAGYMIVFCYCAVAYIIGWSCMKTLVPRYRKVEL